MNKQTLAPLLNKLLRDIHEVEKELVKNEGWSKEDAEKYIHGLISREFNKQGSQA